MQRLTTIAMFLAACASPVAPERPAAPTEPRPPPLWIRDGTQRSVSALAFYGVGEVDTWIKNDKLRAATAANRARGAIHDLVQGFSVALVDDFIKTPEGFGTIVPNVKEENLERGLGALNQSLGTTETEQEHDRSMDVLRAAALLDQRLTLIKEVQRPVLAAVTIADHWDDPRQEFSFALAVLELATLIEVTTNNDKLPAAARAYFSTNAERLFRQP